MRGDPRNIALSVHWDGFSSSEGNKERSTWAVNVGVLNASTLDPIMLLPVLFIPTVPGTQATTTNPALEKMVKKSATIFLRPFIEELEHMFCNGFKVKYNYPSNLISLLLPQPEADGDVIRAMLMLVTGDHLANYKISKLKQSGKAPCRHCKVPTQLVEREYIALGSGETQRRSEYVYGQNLRQILGSTQQRTSKELYENLCKWWKKPEGFQRQEFGKNSGISGESPLWRFYHLYKFDMSLDIVFNVMHTACLQLFKYYTTKLFKKIVRVQCTQDVENICVAVQKARPRELRLGRWPYKPIKTHTRYIAKDLKLFVMWVLPFVLRTCGQRIKSEFTKIGLLLNDIAHLFFNYIRDSG